MKQTTKDKIKAFEIANDAKVETDEGAPYWTVTIWLKEKVKNTNRFAVLATKYISTLDSGGGVIAFRHPGKGDTYRVETWEGIDSFDAFVLKSLERVIETHALDQEACGFECSG